MKQLIAEPEQKSYGGWFIALITAITAVGSLSISIYLPSLPVIGKQFNVGEDSAKLTVTIFLIIFGLAQLVYGPASDKFGRKKVLITGIIIFLSGSIICTVATTFDEMLVGRIVQALGAAAGHALGRAIIRDVMSGAELSSALATVAAAMALSPALGPTLGGYLQVWFGWRSSFLTLSIIAFVLLLLVIVFLRESNKDKDPYALRMGMLYSHYLGLLEDKKFSLFLLSGGFIQMANFIWTAGAPFIYITKIGLKANEYGLVGLCIGLGYVGGTLVVMISKKWPPFRNMLLGAIISSSAAFVLVLVVNTGLISTWSLMLPMIFVCCGMGLTNPTSTALALERHPETAGSASSLLGAAQIAMGAIGTALLSVVSGDKAPLMALLILVVCLLSLGSGLLVSGKKRIEQAITQ